MRVDLGLLLGLIGVTIATLRQARERLLKLIELEQRDGAIAEEHGVRAHRDGAIKRLHRVAIAPLIIEAQGGLIVTLRVALSVARGLRARSARATDECVWSEV